MLVYCGISGGLCHRLRSVVGGAMLARELGVPLRIQWDLTRLCNVRVGEYLDIDGCEIAYRVEERKPQMFGVLSAEQIEAVRARVAAGERVCFHGCTFHVGNRARVVAFVRDRVRPTARLESLLGELWGRAAERGLELPWALACHVRRTDNERSITRSPTSGFVSAVRSAGLDRAGAALYLATDAPETEVPAFRGALRCRVVTLRELLTEAEALDLDRGSARGMELALLELFTLALAPRVLGSYGSAFSDVAAVLAATRVPVGLWERRARAGGGAP